MSMTASVSDCRNPAHYPPAPDDPHRYCHGEYHRCDGGNGGLAVAYNPELAQFHHEDGVTQCGVRSDGAQRAVAGGRFSSIRGGATTGRTSAPRALDTPSFGEIVEYQLTQRELGRRLLNITRSLCLLERERQDLLRHLGIVDVAQ